MLLGWSGGGPSSSASHDARSTPQRSRAENQPASSGGGGGGEADGGFASKGLAGASRYVPGATRSILPASNSLLMADSALPRVVPGGIAERSCATLCGSSVSARGSSTARRSGPRCSTSYGKPLSPAGPAPALTIR